MIDVTVIVIRMSRVARGSKDMQASNLCMQTDLPLGLFRLVVQTNYVQKQSRNQTDCNIHLNINLAEDRATGGHNPCMLIVKLTCSIHTTMPNSR